MTRKQIRDKVRKQLGETTASFWSDSELNQWIEDTIIDINWRAKVLHKTGTMTPVVDTMEYALSNHFSDLLVFENLYFKEGGTDFRKLGLTNRQALDSDQEGWLSSDSSVPDRYAYDIRQDWLLLWPPPNSDNVGTDYVKAYYIYKPTAMSDDDSTPQFPDTLHDTIVEGVLVFGWNSRGFGDRANNSRQAYINGIKDYITLQEQQPDEEIIMRPM